MKLAINNKGVTMMLLVVTVIVLLMITSFAIYYSNNIAPEARLARAYNSLSEIRKACLQAQSSIELKPELYDEYYFFGKSIYQDGSNVADIEARCNLGGEHFSERTYLLTSDNDDEIKRRIQRLEISTVDGYYVADLGNRKYYIIDGVKRKGQDDRVYEFNEIQQLYKVLFTSFKD